MITLIEILAIGAALRIHLAPLANATSWRLIRKTTDDFTGHDDVGAVVVYAGKSEKVLLDWSGVFNGFPYFYRLYCFVDGSWISSDSASATASATAESLSVDVRAIVRDRIDAGLQAEISSGNLTNKFNRIQVLNAPPVYTNVTWPVVSVHLENDSAEARAIGEVFGADSFDDDLDLWEDSEGWLSRWSLTIVGWSLNPDERIVLSQAIKKIIIGNLPVFDDAGMLQVDFSQRDVDDFVQYDAPVYQTYCALSCLAPSIVVGNITAISDVISGVSARL